MQRRHESDMDTMILNSWLQPLTSGAKGTSLVAVRSDSSRSGSSSPVQSLTPSLLCSCGRRHLIQACATSLIPSALSHATPLLSYSTVLSRNCSCFFSFLFLFLNVSNSLIFPQSNHQFFDFNSNKLNF